MCKWCIDAGRAGEMQGKAICVVCPRDSSAATPHVCVRGNGGKPPLFFFLHQSPDAVAMVLGFSGKGKEQELACCQHNWGKIQLFPTSLAAFLISWPLNSFFQTL